MVKLTPWIERKFNFDFPVGLFPTLIERLRGTPVRFAARIEGLLKEQLKRRLDDKWSIQENMGHLINVEQLWEVRLGQYLQGLTELAAADMSNVATVRADFNNDSIEDLLRDFTEARTAYLSKLEPLDEATAARSAFHPRLKTQMRLVDALLFAAEHDDQHMAMITGIRTRL